MKKQHKKRIVEEPFVSLVNSEWRRAKKLLAPLRRSKKPKLYWATTTALGSRSNTHGQCWRAVNTILIHEWYKDKHSLDGFVEILRHELAHLPYTRQAHGDDFMFWLNQLGGKRYVAPTYAEQRRSKKTDTKTIDKPYEKAN
jgi:predicted SprT family Zn-dependent metalloprotease